MKALQTRLDLILERIESPKFLKNDGLGNEIGFWVFDYPAKYELIVREHLKHVDEKLNKRGYRFVHLNIFEVFLSPCLSNLGHHILICGLGVLLETFAIKRFVSGIHTNRSYKTRLNS